MDVQDYPAKLILCAYISLNTLLITFDKYININQLVTLIGK